MIPISSIEPDVALRDYLQGKVEVGLPGGGTQAIPVYGDWERATNNAPDDFIVIFLNGDVGGVGMKTNYANGFLAVSLYSKLNDDGSVKKQRVKKLLEQFDKLIDEHVEEDYFYKYDSPRFITPTTPNITSGYSVTTLNITWHTTNNFNSE